MQVTADAIYLRSGNQLERIDRKTNATRVLAQAFPGTSTGVVRAGLALDGTKVYWTDSGRDGGAIMRANAADGGNPEVLARNQGAPTGVAVDATHVYWTTNSAMRGRVLRRLK
jgi:sugar lactone lactonase YvrE